MNRINQLILNSLLMKSAAEKKYSKDSMPKEIRRHWARQAVREENGAYSLRKQRHLLKGFMEDPRFDEVPEEHHHAPITWEERRREELKAELRNMAEDPTHEHYTGPRKARGLVTSSKDILRAGRKHIAENKGLYRLGAQLVGISALAGATRYGSGVAAKAVHGKIKSKLEERALKKLSLVEKSKRGLMDLVKRNPKLAAGVGVGTLLAGGTAAAYGHHKKAELDEVTSFILSKKRT